VVSPMGRACFGLVWAVELGGGVRFGKSYGSGTDWFGGDSRFGSDWIG